MIYTQEKDMPGEGLEARLQAAFEEAVGRQDGVRQPRGEYTSPGIWEPSADERQACCDEVNKPTPGWGWSLKKHCESSKHVAQLFGVPEAALVKRVRTFKYERNKGRRGAAITFADHKAQPSVSPLVAAHQGGPPHRQGEGQP